MQVLVVRQRLRFVLKLAGESCRLALHFLRLVEGTNRLRGWLAPELLRLEARDSL